MAMTKISNDRIACSASFSRVPIGPRGSNVTHARADGHAVKRRSGFRIPIFGFVCYLGFVLWCFPAIAGHSRSGYLDAGQSVDGRYVVTANRTDTLDNKGKRIDHRWTFTWHDRQSGQTHEGELLGLRTGTDNVFDPVNAHIFVAPGGETFALWMPQSMARSDAKKPATEDRDSDAYHDFAGFGHRLTIYNKNGEIINQLGVKDFFTKADWHWLHFYGCQVYWLVEYDKLDTRQTPRSGHALYRISPDYTVLEFQIGANAEASYRAKQRGVTPPEPRIVRVRLTDGRIVTGKDSTDSNKIPVRPFVGELASKDRPQAAYEPSLDPVRVEGRFIERDRDKLPVRLGQSSPEVTFGDTKH